MENQMNFAMAVGAAVFALGFLSAVVSLALLLSSPGKARAPRAILVAAGMGFAGFLAGAWLGAQHFCAPADAGNLCGLGGVFGTDPLAAGLGLAVGSLGMLKARRSAP